MKNLKTQIFALLLMIPFFSFAQNQEVSVSLGTVTYQGDLTSFDNFFNELNFAAGIAHRYYFNKDMNLHTMVNFGGLSGERNATSFSSSFFDISTGLDFKILGQDRFDQAGNHNPNFSVYLHAGLGLMFNGGLEVNAPSTNPLRDGELDPSGTIFFIPVGGGIKYEINEQFSIGGELIGKLAFSDYIDGLSESRGQDNGDNYIQVGLVLSYRLGGN